MKKKQNITKHAHVIYRFFWSCENRNVLLDFFKYIFLIFAQNIDCGYTLEPPRRGGSNEYPQSMFLEQKYEKKIGILLHTPVLLYKIGVQTGI